MSLYLAINGVEIAAYPNQIQVTLMDLDNAETTTRTLDGRLSRDRIAVKRQIELAWPALTWDKVSAVLQAMEAPFFNFTYPDPMSGKMETKSFYVGNRQMPYLLHRNGVDYWAGMQMTLTEE